MGPYSNATYMGERSGFIRRADACQPTFLEYLLTSPIEETSAVKLIMNPETLRRKSTCWLHESHENYDLPRCRHADLPR
jgi:hypothetical protein